MAKEQLKKVKNCIFGVFLQKSRAYLKNMLFMNTDRSLDFDIMGCPPILGLVYGNAVPNIPKTFLQIGDFVKVVLGAFRNYHAVLTGLSCGDEINKFKNLYLVKMI